MKNFKALSLVAILCLFALSASAQINTLTATTTSAAVSLTDATVSVSSATGLVAPSAGVAGSLMYVIDPGSAGEAMRVQAISGTTISVARGVAGTRRTAHVSGATILLGPANYFYSTDPKGACTAASTYVTPYVNITDGSQWLCSTITLSWVPGWGNKKAAAGATTAVASAAGLVTPSGPLFHITGTSAITGFNIPVGYTGGPICAIPDAIFTTTAANNIALASTAVVSKALCWQYDGKAAKPFFPAY